MKRVLVSLFAVTLLCVLAPTAHAAGGWGFFGTAHVDGQHDHDNNQVGSAARRHPFLQLRGAYAPIAFDHILGHYGYGEPETLHVRDVIRAGQRSRAIRLDGDRIVQSLELWYAKAKPFSTKPEVRLWGQH